MDSQSSYQHNRSPFLPNLDAPHDPSSSSAFNNFSDFNSSAAIDDPSLSVVANPSAPPTPYSPSFAAQAGSYQNSPLGSDISYIPGNEFPQHSPNPNAFASGPGGDQFGEFDISVLPPDYGGDDYDPSAYDAPDNSALLFGTEFMASLNEQSSSQKNNQNQSSSPSLSTSSLGSNNPGVSVSVTPAFDNPMSAYQSGSPFDHGSPASSNGDNDYRHHRQHQQTDVSRSRGSSISSQPNDYQGVATYGMENVQIDSSPNLNQGASPSWAPKDQGQGVQSPPHIFIPGQTPEITHTSPLPSPKPSHPSLSADNSSILPPGGIGMGIHIVPATPVSAGVVQGRPFPNIGMSNQGRASASEAQSQSWQTQTDQTQLFDPRPRDGSPHPPRLPQAPPSQYSFPSNAALTPPPTGGTIGNINANTVDALNSLHRSRDNSPERSNGDMTGTGDFLIPISNPRTRSKSETAVRPQLWQMSALGYETQEQSQSQIQSQGSAGQVGDGSFEQQHHSMQLPRLNAPHFPASFGPPVSGANAFDDGMNNLTTANTGNNYLTPDYAFGAADLRRSRSENQGGHRRNALSADMTPIFADRSAGLAGGNQFNPSVDFLNRSNASFLSPNQSGVFGGSSGLSGHRRSVSHGGSGHSHSRSLSRERVSMSTSPYPSPHASPRMNGNEPLPDPYSFPAGSSGYGLGAEVHVMSHDAQGRTTVQTQAPIQVVRQNVTTHATADASQRRRRTEANFVCPVPGCGSTFTRHFNLKGHLRSHNEERPFKCKWPGCDKGFARQHDCKRHEQLHSNIRPYTCQGCQRTFARMDALNRHLRSDAGTECQAQQPILTTETSNGGSPGLKADGGNGGMLTLKAESDGNWQSSSAGVMV